jgi:hypothetical protein
LQQIEQQMRGEVTAPAPRKKNNSGPSSSEVTPAVAEASMPKRKDKQKLPWRLISGAIGAVDLCLTLAIAEMVLLK